MVNLKIITCAVISLFTLISPANATNLVNPGLQGLSLFAGNYVATAAASQTFGNILSGNVSSVGAAATVFGSLKSVGATTVGANAIITNNVFIGDVLTTGVSTTVGGSIQTSGAMTLGAANAIAANVIAGGAATTGAGLRVGGNMIVGGPATIGADTIVIGDVGTVGALTAGAANSFGSTSSIAAAPAEAVGLTAALTDAVAMNSLQVAAAQSALNRMATNVFLAPTITTDTTLYSGVYSAASLSTTAGTTLTLDGQGLADQFWVFNIADILATGASTNIVLKNVGAGASVIWNTSGYASLGANSTFLGLMLAQQYISVGADASVFGVGNNCGALFSALSYVAVGAGAHVGSNGCMGIKHKFRVDSNGTAYHETSDAPPNSVVPEPANWAMLISGFIMTGAVMRRRRNSTVSVAS